MFAHIKNSKAAIPLHIEALQHQVHEDILLINIVGIIVDYVQLFIRVIFKLIDVFSDISIKLYWFLLIKILLSIT
ncbi:MAG TPA: hypothetical protein VNU45_19865 [Rummeliibacillus sp.]|nr:hypothetical protein [Rummeliibacillus sp.]